MALDVLEEALAHPDYAISRIFGAAGVNFNFLTKMKGLDFVQVVGARQGQRLKLTPVGLEFIKTQRHCRELLRAGTKSPDGDVHPEGPIPERRR
jgi:predicted transcriptional regulator